MKPIDDLMHPPKKKTFDRLVVQILFNFLKIVHLPLRQFVARLLELHFWSPNYVPIRLLYFALRSDLPTHFEVTEN